MAIKALFPEGTTSTTLDALHQWDYGQTLEIEAASLPSVIEVHFACQGMSEAVVHTCSAVNGIARVAIPDRCLEQTYEITAWVYEIDGSAGRTIYSITIPIIARTRPARSESIPQSVQDTYTQLITEVNNLANALLSGVINVGYATRAGLADKATSADSATTATSANTAGSASKATSDADGNNIANTYLKIPADFVACPTGTVLAKGLYIFRVLIMDSGAAENHVAVADIGGTVVAQNIYSGAFAFSGTLYRLKFGSGTTSGAKYEGLEPCEGSGTVPSNYSVLYRKLMD